MASFPGQSGTGAPLPNPPLNLAVTGSTTSSVSLSWNAPLGGATSYNLYRNGIQVQTGISGTSTTDTGLSPGTSYTYYVTAQKAIGEGSRSNPVVGSTGAVPNAPQSLAVTGVTSSSVSLSWTAPVGGATSYNLYRNGTKVQNSISGTSTTDTGLSASTGYTYYVTGTNSFGEGPQSNQVVGTTLSSGGARTWNPGWNGNFNTNISKNGSVSNVTFETNLVGATPGMNGYNFSVTWSFLEPTQGNYNLAGLMSLYNQMASYSPPRHTSLTIQAGAFTSTHPGTNDDSILPLYLQQNVATYGQAGYRVGGVTTTPAGVSGWWGGDGNGNTYAACLHRPAVMNRFIALAQWVGSVVNSLPLFDVFIFQENSFWIGAVADNGGGSGYSDTLATTAQTNWCNAATAALPNKNVSFENTFMNLVTATQQFESTLINAQCMAGQTDTRGQTFINSKAGVLPTWGMAAYGGVQLAGSTATVQDWRVAGVHSCCQIEAPDLGAFGGVSGGNVPITLSAAPTAGATSAQIAASSNGGYWPNGTGYVLRFSDNSTRTCTVADTKTFTWSGGVGSGLTTAVNCVQGGANGWSPQDIADAVNDGLSCAIAYYCVIPNSATYVSIDRRWSQGSAIVLANPIVNTSYPTNYPT